MKKFFMLAAKSDLLKIFLSLGLCQGCAPVPEDVTCYLNVTLSPLQEPKAAKPDIPLKGQTVLS